MSRCNDGAQWLSTCCQSCNTNQLLSASGIWQHMPCWLTAGSRMQSSHRCSCRATLTPVVSNVPAASLIHSYSLLITVLYCIKVYYTLTLIGKTEQTHVFARGYTCREMWSCALNSGETYTLLEYVHFKLLSVSPPLHFRWKYCASIRYLSLQGLRVV